MIRQWYKNKVIRTGWTFNKGRAFSPAVAPLAGSHSDALFAGISPAADAKQLLLALRAVPQMETSARDLAFARSRISGSPVAASAKTGNLKTFLRQLRDRAFTVEFWLGLVTGVIVRTATRMTLENTFGRQLGMIIAASAGLAAGTAVHFVRTLYRNLTARDGVRHAYFGTELLESALTGLCGGFIGGSVAHITEAATEAGSWSLATEAGIAVGAANAAVYGARSAYKNRSMLSLGRQILQGAILGATGGIIGMASADLLAPTSAMAADATVNIANPATVSSDGNLTITPIHNVAVPTTAAYASAGQAIATPVAPGALSNGVICHPRHPIVRHHCLPVRHHHHRVHHIKHAARIITVEKIVEKKVYVQAPAPAPIIIQAPPQVINPCDDCGPCPTDEGTRSPMIMQTPPPVVVQQPVAQQPMMMQQQYQGQMYQSQSFQGQGQGVYQAPMQQPMQSYPISGPNQGQPLVGPQSMAQPQALQSTPVQVAAVQPAELPQPEGMQVADAQAPMALKPEYASGSLIERVHFDKDGNAMFATIEKGTAATAHFQVAQEAKATPADGPYWNNAAHNGTAPQPGEQVSLVMPVSEPVLPASGNSIYLSGAAPAVA